MHSDHDWKAQRNKTNIWKKSSDSHRTLSFYCYFLREQYTLCEGTLINIICETYPFKEQILSLEVIHQLFVYPSLYSVNLYFKEQVI